MLKSNDNKSVTNSKICMQRKNVKRTIQCFFDFLKVVNIKQYQ